MKSKAKQTKMEARQKENKQTDKHTQINKAGSKTKIKQTKQNKINKQTK